MPFTVRVKAELPALQLVGLIDVTVGATLTVKFTTWLDVPPPGAGLVTVIGNVPAVAMSAAVMAAVTWVVDTYVVVRALPFQLTTEVDTKLVPFTVRVKALPPALAFVGLIVVTVGVRLLTVKLGALVVTPPDPPAGDGVNTVTVNVPPVAMSAAVMGAVNWIADTYVVLLAVPFQLMTEVDTKLVPFTVRVKAELPALAFVGLIDVTVGAPLTVKFTEPDVPPAGAGLVTVTGNVPAVATSAALMDAVNWVVDTYVVLRALPFQLTTEVVTKLAPFTVRVKPGPPAVELVGPIVESVGVRLLTVKVSPADVPPPGVGLVTVTVCVPPGVRFAAGMTAVRSVPRELG